MEYFTIFAGLLAWTLLTDLVGLSDNGITMMIALGAAFAGSNHLSSGAFALARHVFRFLKHVASAPPPSADAPSPPAPQPEQTPLELSNITSIYEHAPAPPPSQTLSFSAITSTAEIDPISATLLLDLQALRSDLQRAKDKKRMRKYALRDLAARLRELDDKGAADAGERTAKREEVKTLRAEQAGIDWAKKKLERQVAEMEKQGAEMEEEMEELKKQLAEKTKQANMKDMLQEQLTRTRKASEKRMQVLNYLKTLGEGYDGLVSDLLGAEPEDFADIRDGHLGY